MMDRRTLLSLIAGTITLPGTARALPVPPPVRRLHLVNAHTGDIFDGVYRSDAGPIPDRMTELSVFLRDFHSGSQTAIDVAALDFLAAVMTAVGATSATVLSAYRTRETNAMLARTHFGVAENSQHLYGRALDVHFGSRLADAMRAARQMQRGGVGWYPASNFIHLDSGPVRNWDLDGSGFGTLLLAARRIPFDTRDIAPPKPAAPPANPVPSLSPEMREAKAVSQRLAQLRAAARAAYLPGRT
jgi:uncharacterized protein YcbK (DUF882 family)